MYRWERTMRDGGFGVVHEKEIPSFSSSLLDEIYRSIDEEERADLPQERGCYMHAISGRKQSKCSAKKGEVDVFDRIESVRAGGWVEKRAKEREMTQRRQVYPEPEKKPRRNLDFDHDAVFFSSTSSSSDSSSNGFSSSDTESMYGGVKTRTSCFVPLPRPKPVRTNAAVHSDKTGAKTEFSLFQEQRKLPVFDGGDEGMIKSKSRALKIYSNLKKIKQPISPGGKLSSFINSLFAANNTPRKPKRSAMSAMPHSKEENVDRKLKSGDSSACSSASSFSRSCLSKYSPATREKLRNRTKRTVQFYPVSMILDEDTQPCGQKSLYPEHEESEKENANKARSVSLPVARKSGTYVHKKIIEETRHNQLMDRSSQAEEAGREFLRNYHRNQKKIEKTTNVTTMTSRGNHQSCEDDDDRDFDDDAASCTSSDLFELDHLSVLGNDKYCEELPVYGTTHVGAYRAIASGLIM